MSKDKIFSASSLALDRVLFHGGTNAILAVDESIHSKTNLSLSMDITHQFADLAKYSKSVRNLMDGGLMFHLKMECVLRQRIEQKKRSQ